MICVVTLCQLSIAICVLSFLVFICVFYLWQASILCDSLQEYLSMHRLAFAAPSRDLIFIASLRRRSRSTRHSSINRCKYLPTLCAAFNSGIHNSQRVCYNLRQSINSLVAPLPSSLCRSLSEMQAVFPVSHTFHSLFCFASTRIASYRVSHTRAETKRTPAGSNPAHVQLKHVTICELRSAITADRQNDMACHMQTCHILTCDSS